MPENPRLIETKPTDRTMYSKITLLDLFAVIAMHAHMQEYENSDQYPSEIAEMSYRTGAAMVAERERREG